MKSKTIDRILKALTPEKKAEMKQKRLGYKTSLTPEYQLGYFVGEKIVSDYLPTLSIDYFQTRKVIKISEEDEKEHTRLDEAWDNLVHDTKDENITDEQRTEAWNNLMDFRKQLEQKYLPNPLVCHLHLLNIQNEKEFKEGLINSLWNSDICYYDVSPENIKIYDDEELYFTNIEFILDK